MVSSKGRIGVAAIVVIIVAVMAVLMLYPHQIEVTSEGEGTVTPSGMQEIRFGECLELDIQSSEGYISEVYVDGVLKGRDVDGFIFKAPILNLSKHSILVRFVEDVPPVVEHTLTVASEGDGTVTPSGTTSHAAGEVVTIVATPSTSNVISDILIDGTSVGPSNSIKVTMDSDHSVQVVFRPMASGDIPVTVSVDVDVDIVVETLGYSGDLDFGTVTPSGTVHVAPHSSLTIMITLNPGFEVKDLSIGGVSKGAVTEYTIEDVSKPVSVELSIVKKVNGYIIKASSGTGGSISPSGDVKVAEGEDQTFSFSASSGYKVSHLMIDGTKVTASGSSYTFRNVTSAHSIEVVFTYTGGGGGGGSTVTLSGIQITTPPTKTSYLVGESFDQTGMVVTAVYSDGNRVELRPSQYTVSVDDPLTLSSTTVTVSYQGKTVTQGIMVDPLPVLDSIQVNNYPTKVSYQLNETFDPAGMDIIATYSDGSTSVKTTGFTTETRTFTSYGPDSITVTYTEGGVTKTCSVPVTVVDEGAFTAMVVSYTGTKVSNGSIVQITGSETISTPLGGFSFDLSGIVPGIKQTIKMELRNNWSSSVYASVFVDHISGSSALADQILLTVSTDGTTISKRLSQVVEGGLMTLGTVDSGNKMDVTLSLEFLNLPENNLVMDQSLSFSLGIDGSEPRT